MSTASVITPISVSLIAGRTRAYFAPVERGSETPTIYDPARTEISFSTPPPSPWVDLGWISDFSRVSETIIEEISSGIPATPVAQAFTKLSASVSLSFCVWSKLGMALSTASQHMNVLAATVPSSPIASGAKADAAVSLQPASSATSLYLNGQLASPIKPGDLVVVDEDYVGQTGYVGAAVSGSYVATANFSGSDADYVRRVSFNVGRVVSLSSDGGLELAAPLLAGSPTSNMKLQKVTAFVDREGGNFNPEWSAAFIMEGTQGERLVLHYPRLQVVSGAQEQTTKLGNDLFLVQPKGKFRALPAVDGNDGYQSLCYRTYYPANCAVV